MSNIFCSSSYPLFSQFPSEFCKLHFCEEKKNYAYLSNDVLCHTTWIAATLYCVKLIIEEQPKNQILTSYGCETSRVTYHRKHGPKYLP
jgi:hypothetical protein